MIDKEILQKIEQKVKDSENWSVYHHLTDNLGSPAIMLREANTNADRLGVNIDVFKGYAYLFLDNGTPAEPYQAILSMHSNYLTFEQKMAYLVKPYIKR